MKASVACLLGCVTCIHSDMDRAPKGSIDAINEKCEDQVEEEGAQYTALWHPNGDPPGHAGLRSDLDSKLAANQSGACSLYHHGPVCVPILR